MKLTLLTELSADGPDGWCYEEPDTSVGIWGGWVHAHGDDEAGIPEIVQARRLWDVTNGHRRDFIWQDVLVCECGDTALLITKDFEYDDPEDS